jgi:hypothetical protein
MTGLPDWADRPPSDELAGLALNRPGGDEWALLVGQFILNFGLLEGMTIWWISDLCRDPVVVQIAREQVFGKRVTLIQTLIERSDLPALWKEGARGSWRDAAALARTRNDLAHNPLVSWWTTEDHNRPPDAHGIVPLKRLTLSDDSPAEVITLDQIRSSLERSNTVIEALYELIAQLRRSSTGGLPGKPAA